MSSFLFVSLNTCVRMCKLMWDSLKAYEKDAHCLCCEWWMVKEQWFCMFGVMSSWGNRCGVTSGGRCWWNCI